MLNQEQIALIEKLKNEPYKFGHLLGFNKLTEIHNGWIVDMVRGKEDGTLQAHRGSYKTTCVSIALAIICILYPKEKTMFMRKTDNDIKEVMLQVQKILENPTVCGIATKIWKRDFYLVSKASDRLDTSLTSEDTKGTAQLFAMGTKGSITGKHFDRIFTDDIVNLDDRTSKAERERTKRVYQELQNIKNRGGRIFNTGTPWHKEDAFELMPNPIVFSCYDTGLMTDEEIQKTKDRMTPSLFSANYELRHIADDNVIFRDPKAGFNSNLVCQGECHIDAAYGGADYTAFTILNIVDGKYYVFGKLWQKGIDEVLDKIIDYRKMFNAGIISLEDNADKGFLKKELRSRGERVRSYHENMNKYTKIASYLKAVWVDVCFVEGTDVSYIQQICDFTEEAEHDDAPDSLASLIRRKYGHGGSSTVDPSSLLYL